MSSFVDSTFVDRTFVDSTAFAAELDSHRRELRSHCHRFVGDVDSAEDLAQEAIVRAWCARSRFEGRSSLRTWLYRIATNVCVDALRRRRGTYVVDPDTLASTEGRCSATRRTSGDEPAVAADDDLIDEQIVARASAEATLLPLVRRLPPRQRTVLILRDGLGWSARDTAVAMDDTVAAANSALQRARATLRGLVHEAGRSDGMS